MPLRRVLDLVLALGGVNKAAAGSKAERVDAEAALCRDGWEAWDPAPLDAVTSTLAVAGLSSVAGEQCECSWPSAGAGVACKGNLSIQQQACYRSEVNVTDAL